MCCQITIFLSSSRHGHCCSATLKLSGNPLKHHRQMRCNGVHMIQVNAANCVLGKIGYGTTSECLGHGTPFIFIRRDYFNEEPFLRKQLEMHGLGVEMKRRDFLSGNWVPFLSKTLTMKSHFK